MTTWKSRFPRASFWPACARSCGGPIPAAAGERVTVGGVEIDVGARRVRRGEEIIDLTAIEFDLFLALARRPGRVVPRDLLLSEAGRNDVTVNERAVDVHVSHLRRKLGDDPRAPALIKTVRGVGYVLAFERPSDSAVRS